jgi:adenylate kinase family enzyme
MQQPAPLDTRRIAVIGDSCAGKTTLARALAQRLGQPHVELDTLFWGPGWTMRGPAFASDVADAVAQERWVVDGNYSGVRDLVWPRATLMVWIDRPLAVHLWRALRRNVRRALRREALFGGNRETLARTFFSRESLLLWIVRTHGRRRREFTARMQERGERVWVHLRRDREVQAFLDLISSQIGLQTSPSLREQLSKR